MKVQNNHLTYISNISIIALLAVGSNEEQDLPGAWPGGSGIKFRQVDIIFNMFIINNRLSWWFNQLLFSWMLCLDQRWSKHPIKFWDEYWIHINADSEFSGRVFLFLYFNFLSKVLSVYFISMDTFCCKTNISKNREQGLNSSRSITEVIGRG